MKGPDPDRPARRDYMADSGVNEWARKVAEDLAGTRGRKPLPALRRAALLAVDLQRLFVDPDSPAYVPAWGSARKGFQQILAAARACGAPVFWTRHVHAPEDSGGNLQHFFGRLLKENDPLAAFGEGYGPRAGETEIKKSRHSVFSSTDLAHRLAAAGCDVVVVTGVRAPLCVLASAVDAGAHDVVPVVALDGIAAVTEADHVATLRALSVGTAHVATSVEIAQHFRSAPALERYVFNHRAKDVVVVGAGPAGVAAGLQARRDGLDVVVIGDEPVGGMVRAAGPMANIPGFEPGIAGHQMAERLQTAIRGLDLVHDGTVTGLQRRGSVFEVEWKSGQRCETSMARTIVMATGTRPAPYDVSGWSDPALQQRTHRDLRSLPEDLAGKTVIVVGGGDAALDTALSVGRRGARTVSLVRGDRPRAAAHLVDRVETGPVEMRTRTELAGVEWTGKDVGTAAVRGPEGGGTLAFHHLVVCVGRVPCDDLLAGLEGTRGIFLAGDLVAGKDRFILRAMGDGQRAAAAARDYLHGCRAGHGGLDEGTQGSKT